ncbi:hypothetical protein EG68_02604 [Paragonimus skrjabini miyazakii]|uniref:Uncharacterized protein n=1 Tax=Paragonimus skrjabini miyazakii TaxID=59628 RepID=A0A8S9Z0Y1_9TREM|nr:hypothetical protein EG68_02604 [Paragonimus skrjabini miyazakii]
MNELFTQFLKLDLNSLQSLGAKWLCL